METTFLVTPFNYVGKIVFGMGKIEIENLFGKAPDYINVGFLGKINMSWGDITVKINKRGIVDEVTFGASGEMHLLLNDIDLLKDPQVMKKLNRIEKPDNIVGFKVYYSLGIAITGTGKSKEERTVSVFSKELVKQWKKISSEKFR